MKSVRVVVIVFKTESIVEQQEFVASIPVAVVHFLPGLDGLPVLVYKDEVALVIVTLLRFEPLEFFVCLFAVTLLLVLLLCVSDQDRGVGRLLRFLRNVIILVPLERPF